MWVEYVGGHTIDTQHKQKANHKDEFIHIIIIVNQMIVVLRLANCETTFKT